MITAEFFGGPRDGDRIQLRDTRPLRVPVLGDMCNFIAQRDDQPVRMNVRYIELNPRLRTDGIWILPWHEAA